MEFCPTCGMLLRYETPNMGQAARFYCPTCPYFASIESRVKIKRKQKLAKKEIEPIFTLEDMKTGGAETDGAFLSFFFLCFWYYLLLWNGGIFYNILPLWKL